MMVRADSQIELADGRRLGYSEFGAPTGTPVLFCHGWPGSRLEAQIFDSTAAQLGIRLIAPDRPGAGLSDEQPGRALADWASDAAALADALGLERFAVLGISGGGPHALACAHSLPQRVTCAIVAAGIGPLDAPGADEDLDLTARLGFALARRVPRLAEWIISQTFALACRDAYAYVDRMAASVPAQDRAALAQPAVRDALACSLSEAFLQGCRNAAQELALFSQPWGFALEQVCVPVHLFHGEADVSVPVSMGRRQAVRLPRCAPRFYPTEAHFSLLVNRAADILYPALRV
jgi:pimeloyl-ACP methyl ester carboxylesterase